MQMKIFNLERQDIHLVVLAKFFIKINFQVKNKDFDFQLKIHNISVIGNEFWWVIKNKENDEIIPRNQCGNKW